VSIVDDDPQSRSSDLAERLAAAGPAALAATVKMLRDAMAGEQRTLRELQALSESAFASNEAQEGMRAFLEKRRPRWAD
jgi:enoyl-CoA hydratase/carnithine racemase